MGEMITLLVSAWLLAPPQPHCSVRSGLPQTNVDVELPPQIGYQGKRKTDNHVSIPVNEAHVGCM